MIKLLFATKTILTTAAFAIGAVAFVTTLAMLAAFTFRFDWAAIIVATIILASLSYRAKQ